MLLNFELVRTLKSILPLEVQSFWWALVLVVLVITAFCFLLSSNKNENKNGS